MLRLRKETRCVSSCRYRPDSVRFESRVVESWSIHSSPTILLVLVLLGAVAAMTLVIGGTVWGLRFHSTLQMMMSSCFRAWLLQTPAKNGSLAVGGWPNLPGEWEWGYHHNREWWG